MGSSSWELLAILSTEAQFILKNREHSHLGITVADEKSNIFLLGLSRTVHGIYIMTATFFLFNSKQTLWAISSSCVCKDGFFLIILYKQKPKTPNFMGCLVDGSAMFPLRTNQHNIIDWSGHRVSQGPFTTRITRECRFSGWWTPLSMHPHFLRRRKEYKGCMKCKAYLSDR